MKEKHQHPENFSDQGHEATFDASEPVGAFLKRTRLSQHKTIEDVAGITRIHASTLKYIEEGVTDKLPAEVFVRGFIKLYAQHLGLDPDETISNYIYQTGGGPQLSKETKDKINARESYSSETLSESSFFPSLRPVFIIALLVLLSFLAYWGYSTFKAKDKTMGGNPPAISSSSPFSAPSADAEREMGLGSGEAEEDDSSAVGTWPDSAGEITAEDGLPKALSRQAAAGSAVPEVSATVTGTENLLPALTDAAPSTGTMKEKASLSPLPGLEPSEPGMAATAGSPSVETGLSIEEIIAAETTPPESPPLTISAEKQKKELSSIQYILEAKFDEITWLRIEIDGQRPREYTFGPGDQETWQAQKSMQLFVGNGGGVSLTMNGKELEPIGPSGRPVKLSFPKEMP